MGRCLWWGVNSRMLLVVGGHYQVGRCLWWGVVTRTRWDVACDGVSILGGTLVVVGCCCQAVPTASV